MASDFTAPADWLAGDPRAVLECPSCGYRMVADGDTLQWHLAVGTLTADRLPVRFWQFSHTVSRKDGGRIGALECSHCNGARGDAEWTPPEGTVVARQGKLTAYSEAHAEAKAFRQAVREWIAGGPLPH
jgi:hypothetical protein